MSFGLCGAGRVVAHTSDRLFAFYRAIGNLSANHVSLFRSSLEEPEWGLAKAFSSAANPYDPTSCTACPVSAEPRTIAA